MVRRSATDSLYGSRHLAARMQASGELGSMDVLVLLDLIGAANPRFFSAFKNTHAHFQSMARIELALTKQQLLSNHKQFYFVAGEPKAHGVEDDHVPFLQRGVGVVHLIALPFPSTWHTPKDNRKNLDKETINNLLLIFKMYTLEYFESK